MKRYTFVSMRPDTVLNLISQEVKDLSYSQAAKSLRKRDVLIDGKRIRENLKIFPGREITIYYPELMAEKTYHFTIVYEDENVIIVNKQKNIEVCDGEENIEKELYETGHIVYSVHRLDRNTDGLVVFAKNPESKRELDQAFKGRGEVSKYYVAEVYSSLNVNELLATAYLKKDAENSYVQIFDKKVEGSEKIETQITTLKRSGNTSTVYIKLLTGKTHQIRAHLAHLGCPILGDGKYGTNEINKKYNAKTLRLTAVKLDFWFNEGSILRYLNDKDFTITQNWN